MAIARGVHVSRQGNSEIEIASSEDKVFREWRVPNRTDWKCWLDGGCGIVSATACYQKLFFGLIAAQPSEFLDKAIFCLSFCVYERYIGCD